MTERHCRIGITLGDPNGIGPEIILKALRQSGIDARMRGIDLVVVGARGPLAETAPMLDVEPEFATMAMGSDWPRVALAETPGMGEPICPGTLRPAAGRAAYDAVTEAVRLTLAGTLDAIVTAPLNKEALHAAGHQYLGHTDLLAALCGGGDVRMMLAHDQLSVVHVTTHMPLSAVPANITVPRLRRTIELTIEAMRDFGTPTPRLAVCGLNPHAGEAGLLGTEDKHVLTPVIAEFRLAGHDISGPHPGDTIFVKAAAGQYDAVIAMYHDQGHIPVKLLGFGVDPVSGRWTRLSGVNVTLGLPIIRTSVDHGTAFDIAGKGMASAESLLEAIAFAAKLARARRNKQAEFGASAQEGMDADAG